MVALGLLWARRPQTPAGISLMAPSGGRRARRGRRTLLIFSPLVVPENAGERGRMKREKMNDARSRRRRDPHSLNHTRSNRNICDSAERPLFSRRNAFSASFCVHSDANIARCCHDHKGDLGFAPLMAWHIDLAQHPCGILACASLRPRAVAGFGRPRNV